MWTTGQRTAQPTPAQITSTAKGHWCSNLERLAKRSRWAKRQGRGHRDTAVPAVCGQRLEIEADWLEMPFSQIYMHFTTNVCLTPPKFGEWEGLQASESPAVRLLAESEESRLTWNRNGGSPLPMKLWIDRCWDPVTAQQNPAAATSCTALVSGSFQLFCSEGRKLFIYAIIWNSSSACTTTAAAAAVVSAEWKA